MIVLHPYQKDVKHGIYNYWDCGFTNVLAVMPTGAGKTVLFSDIVFDGVQKGLKQTVIAHRNELVSQMSIHIAKRGIPHRIVGPDVTISQITKTHRELFNRSFINPSAITAVVGVDTLIARADNLIKWAEQTDRWIIDEAHHVLKDNKWGKAVKMFPHARGLGVTATPCRADGMGLGYDFDGVFNQMIIGPNMRQLIEWGNLSDYEIVCPESDLKVTDEDISASGDYSNKKLRAAAEKSRIVGDVVENYIKFAKGKRAICFATDVKTGQEIADKFNANGIRAANLSAKTTPAVREKYIKEFKNGTLYVLVNVDLFDEGFDVPACEVVIMARPTTSLGKYRQMIGRALRVSDGKLYGLIIDHVGNIKRHKWPDKIIVWTLARRDKRAKSEPDPEDIEITYCRNPVCLKPYEKFHAVCPFCNYAPPLPEPRERSIDMVDGDLIYLDRKALEKMRAETELESPADIGNRVALAAGEFAARGVTNKQIEKIEAQRELKNTIAQWAAIQRSKGRSDSESYRRFYLATGSDVLSCLHADKKRQDYEEMTRIVKGWYE